MSPQRNHLDSFKLVSDLPGDVINTELQSLRGVKHQQHSHLLETFIDIFRDHRFYYKNGLHTQRANF